MALAFKSKKLCGTFYTVCRNYCENKSIYQRNEEGEQPRKVHGQPYPDWRKPWIERDGEFKSKLSVFVEKNPSTDVMNAMQNIPNLSVQKVKDWWSHMKEVQEIQNQKYIPKRNTILGSNLAAVHFFSYRQAAVRLKNAKDWISGDITTLKLPDRYVDGYLVEAIDCTNFHHNGIRYEGLENLTGLTCLKWLSLKNNKHIDVWCIDRIAGQNGKTLEFLDVSGCKMCVGCVIALAKMTALKMLVITDPGDNFEVQAALSMLEQERTNLMIKAIDPETKQELTC